MKLEEQVGKVKLEHLDKRTEKFMYSDGDVEDELLKLFKEGLTEKKRQEILNNNPSWAVRYHLAYERGNLLNWYKFKKGSRILEVGSGCGAITEVLVKNDAHVVANELSERRATINAHRNSNADNLNIVIGNLQDYNPKDKFDYVVCVGVLEYAGSFIHSRDPYHEFVRLLSSFLNPGGKMLIAIENKLGLKYFAGAREDHTRKFFDGINNYPHKELDVKTFGKEELTNLFNDCGIGVQQFYYPHPDYKIPKVVYSDSFLPGVHTTIPKSHLPSPNFDQPREFLFSEQQFALSLEKNKIFDKFANSFLVEGVKGEVSNQSGEVVFGQTSPNRGASYKIRTTAYELNKSGHIRFKKEALTKEAIPHIQKMFTTYRKLTDILTQNKLIRVAQPLESIDGKSAVEFDFIKGQSAEDLLLHAILEDKLDEASEIIKKFTSIIQSLSQNVSEKPIGKNFSKYFGSNEVSKFNHKEVVTSGLLDLNLDNFIIDEKDKSWWLIDYEWRLDVPIPLELVKYRSLFYFFSRHSSMIRSRCDKFDVLQNNILALPKALTEDNLVDPQKINLAYIIEHKYLQPAIFGTKIQQPRPSKYDRAIQEQYYDIDAKEQRLSQLEGDNQNLRESVEQLEKHINQIRASKAYRVASKVARAKKKLIK